MRIPGSIGTWRVPDRVRKRFSKFNQVSHLSGLIDTHHRLASGSRPFIPSLLFRSYIVKLRKDFQESKSSIQLVVGALSFTYLVRNVQTHQNREETRGAEAGIGRW